MSIDNIIILKLYYEFFSESSGGGQQVHYEPGIRPTD